MPSVALNGTNGVNGPTNAPPPKAAKPNIAIYTNAKHECVVRRMYAREVLTGFVDRLFQREIPYPEIGPNDWLVLLFDRSSS